MDALHFCCFLERWQKQLDLPADQRLDSLLVEHIYDLYNFSVLANKYTLFELLYIARDAGVSVSCPFDKASLVRKLEEHKVQLPHQIRETTPDTRAFHMEYCGGWVGWCLWITGFVGESRGNVFEVCDGDEIKFSQSGQSVEVVIERHKHCSLRNARIILWSGRRRLSFKVHKFVKMLLSEQDNITYLKSDHLDRREFLIRQNLEGAAQ